MRLRPGRRRARERKIYENLRRTLDRPAGSPKILGVGPRGHGEARHGRTRRQAADGPRARGHAGDLEGGRAGHGARCDRAARRARQAPRLHHRADGDEHPTAQGRAAKPAGARTRAGLPRGRVARRSDRLDDRRLRGAAVRRAGRAAARAPARARVDRPRVAWPAQARHRGAARQRALRRGGTQVSAWGSHLVLGSTGLALTVLATALVLRAWRRAPIPSYRLAVAVLAAALLLPAAQLAARGLGVSI